MANGKIFLICLILLLAVRVFPQTESPKIVSVNKTSDEMRTNVDDAKPITLAEAVDLALKQASNYTSAQINEQIAAEDIKQAKAGFYPKISALPNLISHRRRFPNPLAAARVRRLFWARTRLPNIRG